MKRPNKRLASGRAELQSGQFRPGDKVAGYFRDSGGDDQDRSVAEQRAEWLRGCQDRQLVPAREFADLAKSGRSAKGRKAFRDLLAYFESGQARIDGVRGLLLWSYSRFARDELDAHYYISTLRRQGYLVQSLKDQIPEGEYSSMFEAMAFWKDAQYSRDLSKHVQRGQQHVLSNYRSDGGLFRLPSGEEAQLSAGGFPPIGYERHLVQTGQNRRGTPRFNAYWKRTEDQDLARRVRLAWEMLLRGASYGEIDQACHLGKDKHSYYSLFRTHTYTGTYSYGAFERPGAFEAYITEEEYDRAQDILDGRVDGLIRRRPASTNYLFSGLAFCGICEAPMYGTAIRNGNGGKYINHYYECSNRVKLKRRHAGSLKVRVKVLEETVLKCLFEKVLTDETLAGIAEAVARAKEVHQVRQADPDLVPKLEAIITEKTAQIKKLALELATSARELGIEEDVRQLIGEAKQARAQADGRLRHLRLQAEARREQNYDASYRNFKIIRTVIAAYLVQPNKDREKIIRDYLGLLTARLVVYPQAVDQGQDIGPGGRVIVSVSKEALYLSANDNTPIQQNPRDRGFEFNPLSANGSAPGRVLADNLNITEPLPRLTRGMRQSTTGQL